MYLPTTHTLSFQWGFSALIVRCNCPWETYLGGLSARRTFQLKSSSFVFRVSTTVLFQPQVIPTQLLSYANKLLHRVHVKLKNILGNRDLFGETKDNPLVPQFKLKLRQDPSVSRPLYQKLTFTDTTVAATHVQDHRINNDLKSEQTGCGSDPKCSMRVTASAIQVRWN